MEIFLLTLHQHIYSCAHKFYDLHGFKKSCVVGFCFRFSYVRKRAEGYIGVHVFHIPILQYITQVDFFWINRDQRSFEWFVHLLSQLEIEQAESGAMERFLDMHMYITSALQRTDMKAVGLQLALDLLHEKVRHIFPFFENVFSRTFLLISWIIFEHWYCIFIWLEVFECVKINHLNFSSYLSIILFMPTGKTGLDHWSENQNKCRQTKLE